jgi:hypothetical protein
MFRAFTKSFDYLMAFYFDWCFGGVFIREILLSRPDTVWSR